MSSGSHIKQPHLDSAQIHLSDLVTLISRFNSDFASGMERSPLYERLLAGLLTMTHSDYGYIAESSCHYNDNSIALEVNATRNNRPNPMASADGNESIRVHPDSLSGQLFRSALPQIANDYGNDPKAICRLPGNPELDNFIAIPLQNRNQVIGVIGLGNRKGGFNRDFAVELAPLANSITALIEADRKANNAFFDPLTGLPNLQIFNRRFQVESSRHNRRQLPFSVLCLEIDHLDTFRKNLGPMAVEACLKQVAEVVRKNLRTEDCFVTTEPEKFAILLVETTKVNAVIVAEKLRQAVSKTLIEAKGLPNMMFPTVSIGITSIIPEDRTLDNVMSIAGRAMRAARDNGGNQVQAA